MNQSDIDTSAGLISLCCGVIVQSSIKDGK